MEYKVIPFVASLNPKERNYSQAVAQQLEAIIKKHTEIGWTYIRLESVTTYVNPQSGCFGIGGTAGYTTTKQLIVFGK